MGFHESTQNAGRERWRTLVETAQSIPTKYPNQKWTPPDVEAWADYAMEETSAEQADIGTSNQLVRHTGFVNVNLYFRQGGTAKSPHKYVDDIAVLFRMLTVTTPGSSDIVFSVPRRSTVGDYQQWYVINLTMPFYSDEVT